MPRVNSSLWHILSNVDEDCMIANCLQCGNVKIWSKGFHSNGKRKFQCSTRDSEEYIKNGQLRVRYGISIEEFNRMLIQQNNVCAICEKSEIAMDKRIGRLRALHTDHDPDTGKVRGLLCSNCNTAIGKLKHDINLLKKAIEYLK